MIPTQVAFAVAAVCLCLEAFFSGSEIAMVSADRVMLRRKAEGGDAGARLAIGFLDNPERLLATTLLGTNMSVVTATTVMTLAFGAHHSGGETVAVALMTPVFLIFAEILPKTLFQANADRLVPRIAFPLRLASIVFSPAIFLLGRFIAAISGLLRVEHTRSLITRDELRYLIEGEHAGGAQAITPGEREMIKSVLDFGDTTVYDVMVPLSEVTALPEDATLGEAASLIADTQHTRIPIYRERIDQVVGVLMAHDVLAAEAAAKSVSLIELMKPAMFVPEAKPTAQLLLELGAQRQHLAVVVDEYGGATGICSAEDILEEIVGEIDDEYDRAPPTVRAEGPGLWRATGRTKIDLVNQNLKISLPEGEDYESLAGLLLEKLKRIPREGEQVRLGDVTLTVLSVTDRAIEEVRIRVARKR
jgi:CBS domain containing-hemolysin-like protein